MADIYVLVDGDDTYDAASVARLIEPLLYGQVDMVNAVRVWRDNPTRHQYTHY